jgi:N-acetylglucosaminyl-diphospho-decaprenol L-rhamnosyltransferase
MAEETRLGVVLVNYRTPQLTIRCVDSILDHDIAPKHSIVIVENFSQDDSPAILAASLPGVTLVCTDENRGYGAGVNIGIARVENDYVLVLNPDTYFLENELARVISLLDADSTIGIVGLNLINPDGSLQYSARRFYSFADIILRRTPLGRLRLFEKRIARHLMTDELRESRSHFDAEWVMGTGFVVRRSAFVSLGGMDESFFLYMEDVDLCARMWNAGYRVVCISDVRLVHDHQRSSAAGVWSVAGRRHLKSLARFRKKHRVPLMRPPGVTAIRRQ